MSVFGVLIVFDFIRRDDGSGISPQLLMADDFIELALFVGLTIWGLLVRRYAASHKRLMILGTMAILGSAIARWPISFNPLGIISIQLAAKPRLATDAPRRDRRSAHEAGAQRRRVTHIKLNPSSAALI
jgi:hypothetical protein